MTNTVTPVFLPPKDGTYQPLRHHTYSGAAWRRTVSPGLFEYVRSDGFDPDTQPLRYLNALQSKADCEKLLLAHEAQRTIPAEGGKGIKISSNLLQAAGEGEDRLAFDAISWGDLRGLSEAQGDGEVGKATLWGRWNALAKSGTEGSDQVPEGAAADNAGPEVKKDLLFCSVFDGHGGPETADLLRRAAHASLAFGRATNPAAMGGEEEAVIKAIKDVIAQLQRAVFERQGSCVATCIVDLKNNKLYVAHAGDVRVVAIWLDEEGGRRVKALTEDHNGHNPAEVKRVCDAHPDDPQAMCSVNNQPYARLLGHLMLSRAVGDVHYNRPEAERQALLAEGTHECSWHFERPTIDPPYLTWEPEVAVHPFVKTGKERLGALIIASDGLWDKMSNEEAALALLAHCTLDPNARTKTNHDLLAEYPLANAEPFTDEEDKTRPYLFADANPATHLIRNAISSGDEDQLREMLSLTKDAKCFRDDIAVMIVDFDLDHQI